MYRTILPPLLLVCFSLSEVPLTQAQEITWLGNITARPSSYQLAWEARQVGVMITWNVQSACIPAGHVNASSQPCQAGGFLPTLPSLSSWTPSINASDWLSVGASFGATYAVLVVDHFSGFLLWPSTSSGGAPTMANTATPTTPDLVTAFASAATRLGMAPGYFYSVHCNWWAGVNEFVAGHRRWGSSAPPLTPSEFDALANAQLADLIATASAAAPISELWFDAGVNATLTPSVGSLVGSLAPHAVCHSCAGLDQRGGGVGVGVRWMGNEEAVMPLPNWGAVNPQYTPFSGDPQGPIYAPASCDTVLSEHHWFNARTMGASYDQNIRSPCSLASAYLTSVGRGCNLILNLAPDFEGVVSKASREAYAGLGSATACLHSHPLGGATNLTLFSATTNPTGVATWALPSPLPPTPCPAAPTHPQQQQQQEQCWSLGLQLSEYTAEAGQRIGAWGVEGCFAPPGGAGGEAAEEGVVDCSGGKWVQLTGSPSNPVPSNATVGIGARRWVRLQHREAGGGGLVVLVGLRVAVTSAYEWGGQGGPPDGKTDIVLGQLELFDWTQAQDCIPGCSLPFY